MSTNYQMQACSDSNGALYSWVVTSPDWGASSFPGPGTALDVALCGGGFVTSLDNIDGEIVNASGAFLLNASGAQLISNRASLVNAGAIQLVNAGGAKLLTGF